MSPPDFDKYQVEARVGVLERLDRFQAIGPLLLYLVPLVLLLQLAAREAAGPQAVVGRQPFRRVLVAKRRLAGFREGLGRLRRTNAARGVKCAAIGGVQLRSPVAMRLRGLDLVGLRQRREQRLRLCDLRHFRRWRKAFERGRKNSVGIDGVAGGLIEFGERQRRTEAEAARPLLTRDRDSSLKRPFRGGRVRRDRAATKARRGRD